MDVLTSEETRLEPKSSKGSGYRAIVQSMFFKVGVIGLNACTGIITGARFIANGARRTVGDYLVADFHLVCGDLWSADGSVLPGSKEWRT